MVHPISHKFPDGCEIVKFTDTNYELYHNHRYLKSFTTFPECYLYYSNKMRYYSPSKDEEFLMDLEALCTDPNG